MTETWTLKKRTEYFYLNFIIIVIKTKINDNNNNNLKGTLVNGLDYRFSIEFLISVIFLYFFHTSINIDVNNLN